MSVSDHPESSVTDADLPPAPARSGRRVTCPRVFWPALGIIVTFVVLALAAPGAMGDLFSTLSDTVVGDLGWYYVLIVSGFVAFALWIAVSPMGDIVLGQGRRGRRSSALRSWFAMLFAAGMGIGLVFWGVAEPLNHFAVAPARHRRTAPAAAARAAIDVTYLHWGLHAWAHLRRRRPGDRLRRPPQGSPGLDPLGPRAAARRPGQGLARATSIDVIAVVGTLFGVATSLGFGVTQVGAGLELPRRRRRPPGPDCWSCSIIAHHRAWRRSRSSPASTRASSSCRTSTWGWPAALLLAVLILGPTVFLLSDFVQSDRLLRAELLPALLPDPAPSRATTGTAWLSGWTTFYWGWWMSWAPFVGVFIARISRGRTVREFVAGVLLVPTLVTFLWFSVLGGSAIYREIFGDGGLIGRGRRRRHRTRRCSSCSTACPLSARCSAWSRSS